jgi:hypothetical protein
MKRAVAALLLIAMPLLAAMAYADQTSAPDNGALVMSTIANGSWRFSGEIGRRVDANVENWLLRVPEANPNMLDMFRRRDRRLPADPLLPWSGEFAGKYLISAVQACRMTDDPKLRTLVQEFVDALIACQAPNGYLGAFKESEQLLGNWDLWNHHHVMTGLLMWHDMTGDQAALDATLRAADLICSTYLDGDRRPIDAGSPECNFAVLTVMVDLFRRTDNLRYRELTLRIEEDMEKAGDWLREGAKGTFYCNLPNNGTRWESLHIVEGFSTLYELTGEQRYKDAAQRLWESIRNRDRHPSGAFSTHERAFGSPYAEGSIETCCSIAWAALSIDVLRLTGDPTVADELELTTWNQFLAAQHPSGNWCTYHNPINGFRAPAFQSIAFQIRPGGGELNCCSVNAPRGLGMLPEWAVMQDDAGLTINFYGPMEASVAVKTGEEVVIRQRTDYPVDGRVRIQVTPSTDREFTLRLRIPEWSASTTLTVNDETVSGVAPGSYASITRVWQQGDRIDLNLDMSLRHWAGAGQRKGFAALYTGPILLAFDAAHNSYETEALKPIDLAKVSLRRVETPETHAPGQFSPMGLWELEGADERVVLCDFGSAGSQGTDFAAWLPAVHAAPTPIWLESPPNGAMAGPGPVHFIWTSFSLPENGYELLVSRDASFENPVVHLKGLKVGEAVVPDLAGGDYYWKVQTSNAFGRQESHPRGRHFIIDPSLDADFESTGAKHDLDAMNERVNPFREIEGTHLLGARNGAASFEGTWLEYPSPSSIDHVGFFSLEKSVESFFTWNLGHIPAGTYELATWIPADPNSDHATNVSYRIHHAQGETTVEVDLTKDKVSWRSLGTFTFDADSRVKVSNQADRNVVLEAIRLQAVSPEN